MSFFEVPPINEPVSLQSNMLSRVWILFFQKMRESILGDVAGPESSVDGNLAEFDGTTGGVIKDGGLSHTNVAAAVSSKHTRLHSVASALDHSWPSKVVSASYTLTSSDFSVLSDTASVTLSLPASSGSGQEFRIGNTSAGNIAVVPDGTDKIDGESTQTLHSYDCMDVVDYSAGFWKVV